MDLNKRNHLFDFGSVLLLESSLFSIDYSVEDSCNKPVVESLPVYAAQLLFRFLSAHAELAIVLKVLESRMRSD